MPAPFRQDFLVGRDELGPKTSDLAREMGQLQDRIDAANAEIERQQRLEIALEEQTDRLRDSWTKLNSALEIGKKAYEAVKFVIEETVPLALEQRDANDAGRQAVEALIGTFDEFKKTVGDAIIDIGVSTGALDTMERSINTLIDTLRDPDSVLRTFFELIVEGARLAAQSVSALVGTIEELGRSLGFGQDRGSLSRLQALTPEQRRRLAAARSVQSAIQGPELPPGFGVVSEEVEEETRRRSRAARDTEAEERRRFQEDFEREWIEGRKAFAREQLRIEQERNDRGLELLRQWGDAAAMIAVDIGETIAFATESVTAGIEGQLAARVADAEAALASAGKIAGSLGVIFGKEAEFNVIREIAAAASESAKAAGRFAVFDFIGGALHLFAAGEHIAASVKWGKLAAKSGRGGASTSEGAGSRVGASGAVSDPRSNRPRGTSQGDRLQSNNVFILEVDGTRFGQVVMRSANGIGELDGGNRLRPQLLGEF